MNLEQNFVIIGCGDIASRHANAITKFGNLIGVYDNDINAAQKFASTYNCNAINNWKDVFKSDANVISICTPNWLHSPQSIECLQNGFHVVCEKPMAIKYDDALQMIETSKKCNKQLFIVKQLRHYPHLIYLKKLIEVNKIVNLKSFSINCLWNRDKQYYRNWRGLKQTDGGTLYTQFSHYIDLILWLFGAENCFSFKSENQTHPYIEFEDCGTIEFKMASGVTGNFTYSVNTDKNNIENTLQISTETGWLKLSGAYLDELSFSNIPELEIISNRINFIKAESHYKVYEEVIKALQNKPNNATKAQDSIESIRLIEAIYASQSL